MKNLLLIILSIILLEMLTTGCKDSKNPTSIDLQPIAEKEWTFLFYNDADFENAYDPLEDLSELVSSGFTINYIVLRDKTSGGADYFEIHENHTYSSVHSLGEVNMGSTNTLNDFISFGKLSICIFVSIFLII